MAFAQIGGLSFWYERRGAAGAPLLFISGTGCDLRRPETRFFGPLARQFDLLGTLSFGDAIRPAAIEAVQVGRSREAAQHGRLEIGAPEAGQEIDHVRQRGGNSLTV